MRLKNKMASMCNVLSVSRFVWYRLGIEQEPSKFNAALPNKKDCYYRGDFIGEKLVHVFCVSDCATGPSEFFFWADFQLRKFSG